MNKTKRDYMPIEAEIEKKGGKSYEELSPEQKRQVEARFGGAQSTEWLYVPNDSGVIVLRYRSIEPTTTSIYGW